MLAHMELRQLRYFVAVPSGYRKLRRVKIFTGSAATFTAPVLSGGRLYCRSYAGEIACLSLAPARGR